MAARPQMLHQVLRRTFVGAGCTHAWLQVAEMHGRKACSGYVVGM